MRITKHQVEIALRHAKANRQNHKDWFNYRKGGGKKSPGAGPAGHHSRAITEYNRIVAVLEVTLTLV